MRILINSLAERRKRLTPSLERLIKRVARKILKAKRKDGTLSITLVDNKIIRKFNKRYRRVDRVTDVLAFPMEGKILGDVIISVERIQRNAQRFGYNFEEELSRVLAHGVGNLLRR